MKTDPIEQIEKALVGMLMLNDGLIPEIIGTVGQVDFKSQPASKAFGIIIDRWKAKKSVDLVSIAADMTQHATYLADAVEVIPTALSAKEYAHRIANASCARRTAVEVRSILESIDDEDPRRAHRLLSDFLARESTQKKARRDAAYITDEFNQIVLSAMQDGDNGIPTGYRFLDDVGALLRRGDIWVVGGFTSVGKTSFLVDMVSRLIAGDSPAKVMVVSTEMTQTQIMARLVANLTGIPTRLIMSGRLEADGLQHVQDALKVIRASGITIADDIYEAGEIEAAVRAQGLVSGLDVVFIDYVQNCIVDGAQKIYDGQSRLANRFQRMAKDNDLACICLSQLSNEAAKDVNIVEYKGAGEWAAVADVGLRLFRRSGDDDGLIVRLSKNRHGPRFKDDMGMRLQFVRQWTALQETGFVER